MIGRQVIETKEYLELEDVFKLMQEKWDKENFNDFYIGKPTAASLSEYILLPNTERFMVIVHTTKGGRLFSKNHKVVLSVVDSVDGVKERFSTSLPSSNIFYGAYKISTTLSIEKERKGPAEDGLLTYAEHMRKILDEASLI